MQSKAPEPSVGIHTPRRSNLLRSALRDDDVMHIFISVDCAVVHVLFVFHWLEFVSFHIEEWSFKSNQMARSCVPVSTGEAIGCSLWQYISAPVCTDMRQVLEDQE